MGVANVIGTQYLLPTKRQKEYTISIVVGTVFNFVLNYILISKFASVGASIATVLSQVIVDGMQFYAIRNDISFMEVLKYTYKYLIASISMFIACSLSQFIVASGIASIILQVVIGVIIYMGALILLKEDYVYYFINKIKERFLKQEVK